MSFLDIIKSYLILWKTLIIQFLNNLFRVNSCKIDRGNHFSNSLLILGDDLAAGVGDDIQLGRPRGIAYYLKLIFAKNKNIRQTWNIYNLGVANSTTHQWLPTSVNDSSYLTLFDKQVYADAKIVVLMVGSNDHQHSQVQDSIKNIQDTIQLLLNMNKIVLVSILPTVGLFKNVSEFEWKSEFNEQLIDLIQSHPKFSGGFNRTGITRIEGSQAPKLFLGPLIDGYNYEYKGSFLYHQDKFNRKGYMKLAKDYEEILAYEMIKIEFVSFKQRLGI